MEMEATTENATTARAPTAAEKRAARRARVLKDGENRMKLLSGQISSLKEATKSEEAKLMDEGVEELLQATDTAATEQPATDVAETATSEEQEAKASAEIKFPPRVDPVQRRRDAAARRKKKEAVVNELLGVPAEPTVEDTETTDAVETTKAPPRSEEHKSVSMATSEAAVHVPPPPASAPAPTTRAMATPPLSGSSEKAFARHTLALRLHVFVEYAIMAVIVLCAASVALTMDLRTIKTDFSRPGSDDVVEQMEQWLAQQQAKDASSQDTTVVPSSGFFSSLIDLPQTITWFVEHPPVLLLVLLIRVAVTAAGDLAHRVMGLPDVQPPQEDDLGFLVNLVLSSRPKLKGYLVQSRKLLDDVLFFLFFLVLTVAVRAFLTSS